MNRKYAIILTHHDEDGNETDGEVLTRHFFWVTAALKLWLTRKLNSDEYAELSIGRRVV